MPPFNSLRNGKPPAPGREVQREGCGAGSRQEGARHTPRSPRFAGGERTELGGDLGGGGGLGQARRRRRAEPHRRCWSSFLWWRGRVTGCVPQREEAMRQASGCPGDRPSRSLQLLRPQRWPRVAAAPGERGRAASRSASPGGRRG